MSIKHNPPRQSVHRGRSVVAKHDGQHSVGTKRPAILDPTNGRDYDGGSGSAPGANGPPTTGGATYDDD
jgi:hypothetical protein